MAPEKKRSPFLFALAVAVIAAAGAVWAISAGYGFAGGAIAVAAILVIGGVLFAIERRFNGRAAPKRSPNEHDTPMR